MAGYIKGISHSSQGFLGLGSSKDETKTARFGKKEEKYEYRSNHINYGGSHIQNVKAARVYVFGDSNYADDDDETVEFEMRSRHKKGSTFIGDNNIEDSKQFFEKEIAEGETLQAIALKYACQVSEIKRINNLIQDQEFYALKVIKIPMTKYGILSEQFGNHDQVLKHPRCVKNSLSNSIQSEDQDLFDHFNESDTQHDLSDPETQIKVLRSLSIRDNLSSENREAEKFLQKMDADLNKFKNSSRGERESLTEVISVLTNKSIHPLETSKLIHKGNGADCGISWWSILIASLAIALIAPLVFLIYYYFLHHDGSN